MRLMRLMRLMRPLITHASVYTHVSLSPDSIDIETGVDNPVVSTTTFGYKKLRPATSNIHYHSGPDLMSSSLMDEAQEPLISGNGYPYQ